MQFLSIKHTLNRAYITDTATTAYTSESIGMAERLNRIIVDKVRAMLKDDGSRNAYLEEALNNASYSYNRTILRALTNRAPHHMFFGTPQSLTELKIFGWAAYTHINKENRRSELYRYFQRGIFLWIEEWLYQIQKPNTQTLTIYNQVRFNECMFSHAASKKETIYKNEWKLEKLWVRWNEGSEMMIYIRSRDKCRYPLTMNRCGRFNMILTNWRKSQLK